MNREEKFSELRAQAQRLLEAQGADSKMLESNQLGHVLEELNIHQIELEMQHKELREAYDRLEYEKQAFQELYQDAPVAYFTFSFSGNVLSFNAEGRKLLRTGEESLANRSFFRFLDEESKRVFTRVFRRASQDGRLVAEELELRRQDGQEVPVRMQARAIRLPGDGDWAMRCAFVDLSVEQELRGRLRRERQRFQAIADFTYDWEHWLLPDGSFNYVSPSVERVTGYSPEEFLQDPGLLRRIIHPDDLAAYDTHFKAGFKGHDNVLEMRIARKDGALEWIGHQCQQVFLPDGSPAGWRGSNRQITQHKIFEQDRERILEELKARTDENQTLIEELRQLNEYLLESKNAFAEGQRWLQAIMGTVQVGIGVTDGSGGFTMANSALLAILGFGLKEIRRLKATDLTHEDDLDATRKVIDRFQKGKLESFNMQKRMTRKDGTVIWVDVSTSAMRDREGALTHIVGAFRDITEQKAREQEIRKLTAAVHQNPASIVITDPEGRIEYVNPRFEQITGYKLEEVAGQTPRLLRSGHQGQAFYENLWNTILAKKAWEGEVLNRRKDGSQYWEEMVISPIVDEQGRIRHLVASKNDISQKKKALLDLVESEAKLKSVFAIMDVGITLTDEQGYVIDCNPASEVILGISKEDHLRRNYADDHWNIIRPDGSPMPASEYASVRALTQGRPVHDVHMGLVLNDKSVRWINVSAMPIAAKGYGVAITYVDVTRQTELHRQLLESERRFRTYILSSPTAVLTGLLEGGFQFANPAAEQLLGCSREELLSRRMADFVRPEQRAATCGAIRSIPETGGLRNFQTELRRADDSLLHASIDSVPLGPDQYMAFIKDITPVVEAQRELEERTRTLQQFFDVNLDLLCIARNDGVFLKVNKAWGQTLGLDENELLGTNFLDLVHPDDKEATLDALSELQHQHQVMNFVNRYRRSDGSYRFIEWRSAPSGDTIFASARDITERKQFEGQLQQYANDLKASNETKDKFLSIIAHDLKNPFNLLLGFSEMLLENHREYDVERRERQIRAIYETSRSTFAMLEDLLAWARAQTGRLEVWLRPVELRDVCQVELEKVEPMARKKNLALRLESDGPLMVMADSNMLATTLRNLLTNAIKFSEPGGLIVVRVEAQHEMSWVIVRDNGTGMGDETLSNLFKINKKSSTIGTRGETGTGLGLLLCKEFVQKQGGQILVSSTLGKGSEFRFSLPIWD